MEHDGAIDDLLSQLLLLTMKNKELIGINVTPADCFIEPALESSYKLLQLFNREDIPLGRSESYGVHAFPDEWRARPEVANALPMLINLQPAPDPYGYPAATDLLVDKLSRADEKVSILMTGPCTNLVKSLERKPEIEEKIKKIVWMGGAFRTGGNVQTYQHDGSAEWNVFWDPFSSKKLLELNLPLTLIPLDVTNTVPVSKKFLSRLARQSEYRISDLAGQLWASTIDTIPSYHYVYFMWDVLATSYLDIPDEFTIERVKATISTKPPNAGQTLIDSNGYEVTIATGVNKEVFYEYLLGQFKRGTPAAEKLGI